MTFTREATCSVQPCVQVLTEQVGAWLASEVDTLTHRSIDHNLTKTFHTSSRDSVRESERWQRLIPDLPGMDYVEKQLDIHRGW